MNYIVKILIAGFFLTTYFYKAQCYKVLKAEYDVSAGGREESRRETIHLSLKNNAKLEAKYLLIGAEKLEIEKSISNNIITIKADYFPVKDNALQVDPKTNAVVTTSNNFDLTHIFLVSEKRKTKKIVKQKIKIDHSKKSDENQLPLERPYQ